MRRAILITLIWLAATPLPASALEYPSRQVELIAGYGAGGGMDVLARYFADRLGALSGKSVVVMNKPGANGNLAAQEVAQARPDGHKLLWAATSTYASNQFLYKNLPFDARRDLTIVSTAAEYGFILVTRADPAIASVDDLKSAVSRKDKTLYGASGATTMAAGEMFKTMSGVKASFVSYKTAQDVMRDVSAGDIDFGIVDATAALARARQGGLKPLAVTMARRMSMAPDISTFDEAGVKGYELNGWMAVAAPSSTPAPIVAQLSAWMKQIVDMPETQAFLTTAAAEPFYVQPDKIPAFVDAQTQKWRKLIEAAGIQPQ